MVNGTSEWWRLGVVALILAASVSWLLFLASMAPEEIGFPSDLSQLRQLSQLLSKHSEESPAYAVLLFASAYLFKQAFAIPGSVFLNALAGAVFGLPLGLALCSALTGLGATCCCLLARFCGAQLAERLFPKRLAEFKSRLRENEDGLTYFLLALRLFPATPNWAINVGCGVLRVPLLKFFPTVVVGLMPYNYLCVQAGVVLATVESMSDVFSWAVMLQMAAMAAVATLPGLLTKRRSGQTSK